MANAVADRFIDEAAKHLSGVTSAGDVRRLLFEMALSVPLGDLGPGWVEGHTLLAAGLLRKVGSTVRFRSDVEGDLVLRFVLRTPAGKAWVKRELAKDPLTFSFASHAPRRVGAARACRRELVLDLYTAIVATATNNPRIPQPGFEGLHVCVPSSQRRRILQTSRFDLVEKVRDCRVYERHIASRAPRLVLTFASL